MILPNKGNTVKCRQSEGAYAPVMGNCVLCVSEGQQPKVFAVYIAIYTTIDIDSNNKLKQFMPTAIIPQPRPCYE